MSQKCRIIQPGPSAQGESSNNPIDWHLCFLCQSDTEESLKDPANAKNKSNSAYDSLASNILHFWEIGSLPMDININTLDNGSGIAETLEYNKAQYHKSCSLQFNNDKLKRAKRRASTAEKHLSPKKTRSSLAASTPLSPVVIKCFFCDKSEGSKCKAQTKSLSDSVTHGATILQDSKIMAKLAISDMIALSAEYHLACLVLFKNRVRQHNNSLRDNGEKGPCLNNQ